MKKLNMNEYRIEKKKMDEIKYKTFLIIYNTIIEQIKLYADNMECFCLYELPFFIFGEPNYDISDLKKYIINKLTMEIQNGNLCEVSCYEPNILYIKWNL